MASRLRPAHPVTCTPGRRRRARSLTATWGSEHRSARTRINDESGAVLILALVFLVAVSLIVTGLLTFVGTSLNATGSFANDRNVEFTSTSAVNLAIQNTRYSFDVGSPHQFLNNATPELCASYPTAPQTATVNVYCSMVWQPYSANTRVFTYSACASSTGANAATDCAARPQLQAIVAFDDYPPGVASPSPIPSACTPIVKQGFPPSGLDNGSCGESMTQISWQWKPVVPAITSLSSSTGPTTGGTTVTINGTGFTSGETVGLTPQLSQPPSGTTYNPPIAATIVASPPAGCALPTCIEVTTPSVTGGTAYYVTVTTPGGTSQTAASDSNSFVPIFTYAPVPPTVSGLVGTVAGSITGNTTVTVQGTGFWNAPNNVFPAQIFFCPTGGAAPVSNSECSGGISGCTEAGVPTQNCVVSITAPAPGSTLDTMTALTPQVSSAGSYYVQVEVYNVYSTQTNAAPNTSNEFTYSVQAPLIVSISPLSGVSGTALTISGANFINGSTVGFCAETNGNSTNTNCPTTTSQQTLGTIPGNCWQSGGGCSATQMVVSVPTLAAGTYYPVVTLPNLPAYNSTPPSQPYNQPSDIFTYT